MSAREKGSFDLWWVGYNGAPARDIVETHQYAVAKKAWGFVAKRHDNLERQIEQLRETNNVLRGQLREVLVERDEAVRLQQRHEDLRRQTERQCDRIRKQLHDRIDAPIHRNHPRASTLISVVDEVKRAREKFPSNQHLLAALTEEVGELAEALLDNQGKDRVYAEAMQCACVAIRIMEEGDSDFDDGQQTLKTEKEK